MAQLMIVGANVRTPVTIAMAFCGVQFLSVVEEHAVTDVAPGCDSRTRWGESVRSRPGLQLAVFWRSLLDSTHL